MLSVTGSLFFQHWLHINKESQSVRKIEHGMGGDNALDRNSLNKVFVHRFLVSVRFSWNCVFHFSDLSDKGIISSKSAFDVFARFGSLLFWFRLLLIQYQIYEFWKTNQMNGYRYKSLNHAEDSTLKTVVLTNIALILTENFRAKTSVESTQTEI